MFTHGYLMAHFHYHLTLIIYYHFLIIRIVNCESHFFIKKNVRKQLRCISGIQKYDKVILIGQFVSTFFRIYNNCKCKIITNSVLH